MFRPSQFLINSFVLSRFLFSNKLSSIVEHLLFCTRKNSSRRRKTTKTADSLSKGLSHKFVNIMYVESIIVVDNIVTNDAFTI